MYSLWVQTPLLGFVAKLLLLPLFQLFQLEQIIYIWHGQGSVIVIF